MKSFNRGQEKGTALFLILVAVVLFAALTYAVTQSSNGNAVSMSREVADNKATELVSYANLIRDAINRLLLRGCDERQVSFQNTYFLSFLSFPSLNTYACI